MVKTALGKYSLNIIDFIQHPALLNDRSAELQNERRPCCSGWRSLQPIVQADLYSTTDSFRKAQPKFPPYAPIKRYAKISQRVLTRTSA